MLNFFLPLIAQAMLAGVLAPSLCKGLPPHHQFPQSPWFLIRVLFVCRMNYIVSPNECQTIFLPFNKIKKGSRSEVNPHLIYFFGAALAAATRNCNLALRMYSVTSIREGQT